MSIIKVDYGQLNGGGVPTLKSFGKDSFTITLTLNNLDTSKKYILVLDSVSSNSSYSLKRVGIASISGATYETLVEPNNYSSSPYIGNAVHVLYPTSSTVTITKNGDYSNEMYTLIELN